MQLSRLNLLQMSKAICFNFYHITKQKCFNSFYSSNTKPLSERLSTWDYMFSRHKFECDNCITRNLG